MPRLTKSVPQYRKHRASGQAIVTLNGRDHYLGPHGTKASRIEYDRLIGEWLENGRCQPTACAATVSEIAAGYWRYAKSYYVKNGRPTDEIGCIRVALRYLKNTYGRTQADDFGPLALKILRQKMVDDGLSRNYVNSTVARIKRCFKWAVENELISVTVFQAIGTVSGLRAGKSLARESAPVLPVDDVTIEATLPHLPTIPADMVRFQRFTGCRPDEVCGIRPADIDTSNDIWVYRPESHKTEHHGRARAICIGPKAQDILRPYLLRCERDHCFDPSDSERNRNAARRENRQSPMTPSQLARTPKRKPKRPIRKRYDTNSYRRAIHRACDKAGIDRWSPNRLRHSAGTEIRKRFGLEAAQVTLGHASADVTQVYAERDMSLAEKVAREVGGACQGL